MIVIINDNNFFFFFQKQGKKSIFSPKIKLKKNIADIESEDLLSSREDNQKNKIHKKYFLKTVDKKKR